MEKCYFLNIRKYTVFSIAVDYRQLKQVDN